MFGNRNGNIISISTGTIVRVFLVALIIFLIYFLRDLVLVILTAIVVASFVEAVVPRFKKIRIGKSKRMFNWEYETFFGIQR